MSKKLKVIYILALTLLLFVWWAWMAIADIKFKMVNYYWQIALAVVVILFGLLDMLVAKEWSWLKSKFGQGIFSIALGLVTWGIGQGIFAYYVIQDPSQQSPPNHLLDVFFVSSIPLWAWGMLRLSKATGARYGLRRPWAKVGLVVLALVMLAVSYYFLVDVARGGIEAFQEPFWQAFFDLVYPAGDVINLTLAIAIFGLSWKYLGGMFKRPIMLVLFSFLVIYIGDFLFSFYTGKDEYYAGHWVDLTFLLMAATFGIGMCLLDPRALRSAPQALPTPPSAIPPETSTSPSDERTDATDPTPAPATDLAQTTDQKGSA
jgi:hypothetical protein